MHGLSVSTHTVASSRADVAQQRVPAPVGSWRTGRTTHGRVPAHGTTPTSPSPRVRVSRATLDRCATLGWLRATGPGGPARPRVRSDRCHALVHRMRRSSAQGAGLRYGSARGRWVLLASILGSGLAGIDATVVNVALPAIGRDLHTDFASLQWTITAYTLTLASLILLGGALGDRYGRRRVFVIGVVWFAVASLLCGLAPTAPLLIAARALQGVGGALLTPGSLAMIQATFAPQDRARAIGAWSGLGGVATAVGPFVGGWLIQVASWRWVFLINAPLAVVVVLVARRHVPETRDSTVSGHHRRARGRCWARSAWPGSPTRSSRRRSAVPVSPVVVAAALVGLASMVGFVVVESRERHPMLPLGDLLLGRSSPPRTSSRSSSTPPSAGCSSCSWCSCRWSPASPRSPPVRRCCRSPSIMLLLSARAGQLAQRIGPRLPMSLGPLVCAASLVLMLRIGPGADYVQRRAAGGRRARASGWRCWWRR